MVDITDRNGADDAAGGPEPEQSKLDARVQLQQLAADLRSTVLRVVWRQWRELGAGAAGGSESGGHQLRALIDPEALVLISLMLIRDERRLSDVLYDWAVQNSDLLSVQRLKNLETDYPAPVQGPLTHRLSWFAMVALDEGKDSRWKSLAQARSERAAIAPHAHGQQDESLTVIEPAAHARAAYPSGDVFAKLRGVRVRLTPDAALLLRLRLGFGVGLKADVVGFLLTRVDDWATVRDITDALGYTVAAVRRVAEDMAAARLIESRDGQPASYRTAVDAWKSLLRFTDRPPRWASWQERFVFATSFLHWAEEIGDRPLSAYAFGAQGRHMLEKHRSAFEHDGIAVWSAHAPVNDWGAFAAASVRSLAAWIEENG
ncbi:MAG TPA: hypothetical protein VII52_01360 [Gemmatimonadaceae bacterium]